MNNLDKFAEFTTVEEGENKLKEAYILRDKMGGALYWNIVNDDCKEIAQKLEELKRNEKNKTF